MATIRVATVTEFNSALSTAQAGDVIELAAGDYSALSIKNFNPAGTVTIRSADAANPAHIGDLLVSRSSNLAFSGLEVGRDDAYYLQDAEIPRFFRIEYAQNITVDALHVHGSLDGNPQNDGRGMEVKESSGVIISNSEFEQLHRALTVVRSENVSVLGNNFHDLRSDGINVIASSFVTIDSNSFTDFYPADYDHPDAIQFWTSGQTSANTDIIIRNNQITQGNGSPPQGIFLRDEVGTLPYERVTIENNLIYTTTMSNGITVGNSRDIKVLNNTVISPSDDTVQVWIRLRGVIGGTVSGNVTDQILFAPTDVVSFSENIVLRDSPEYLAMLPDLNLRTAANLANLIIPGFGYRFAGIGSAIWLPVPPATTPPADTSGDDETSGTDPVDGSAGPVDAGGDGDAAPDDGLAETPDDGGANDPADPPIETVDNGPVSGDDSGSETSTPPQQADSDSAGGGSEDEQAAAPGDDGGTVTPDSPTLPPAQQADSDGATGGGTDEQAGVTDPVITPPGGSETPPADAGQQQAASKKSAVVAAKPIKKKSSATFSPGTVAETSPLMPANDPFAVAAKGMADGSIPIQLVRYDYLLASNG